MTIKAEETLPTIGQTIPILADTTFDIFGVVWPE